MGKAFVFFTICFLCFATFIFAQGTTTADFNGLITDNDGNPIVGATVTALHGPTGTTYTALSRLDGHFNIPAVKVGGPYTITVSSEAFKTQELKGITMKLGESRNLKIKMSLETISEEVTVTATNPVIADSRTGASQNILSKAIENLPTISRSINDFTRMAPQFAGGELGIGVEAAGRNMSYNNIQIDGAVNNDLFGLRSNGGTPGGAAGATPISLDAVEEIQIVLAPYDVRQGGFSGGGINVITRSGTNDFHGSAFFYGRNQEFVGNGPDNTPYSKFSESIFGARVGGPIVKNKLFFFLNGEMTRKAAPEDFLIDDSGSSRDFGGTSVSVADCDKILSLLNKYGYDGGTYGEVVNDTKTNKLFARLDWNINSKHRLTFRQNFIDASSGILRNRASASSFSFSTNGYVFVDKNYSTVLQLNSTVGKNSYNELILNYAAVRDHRDIIGEPFPQVTIKIGGKNLIAGTEQYSTANSLDQFVFELTDNLTIFKGKHTFNFGTHNEFFKFINVFVSQNFGTYTFNSLADFENGKSSFYAYTYSNTSDPKQPAKFRVTQFGLYASDTWAVLPNLKLTLGFRTDAPLIPDTPLANPAVEAGFGIKTDQNAGGNILYSPRFGFNWDVYKNEKMQVRGGIGIFSGRTPYVMISNQYSNAGVELTRYSNYSGLSYFEPDPYNQPKGTGGINEINLIDEKFKMPQVLKTSIAVDRQLPFGFTGTVEFMYSKNINEVLYQNLNIKQTGVSSQDGRQLYGDYSASKNTWTPRRNATNFGDVIYLTNTNQGFQYNFTLQLQKVFASGDLLNLAYTYGVSKDVNSCVESTAKNLWGNFNMITGDPNNPDLAYSNFDMRHRLMFAHTRKIDLLKNAPTYLSLIYTGYSGRPYSTKYSNDFNGDGQTNDCIYVPRDASDIILTKGTWADLDAYIKADPSLDSNRGKIAPRNVSRDPWAHLVDFKFAQDIPLPALASFANHKLQLTIDVLNILNIFNRAWGVVRWVQFDNTPLELSGFDAAGKPKFNFSNPAQNTINQLLSRWKAMLGFRYIF